jgi:Fe-S cluster assembly protein SufB
MSTEELLKDLADYKYGFVTEIETDAIAKGLSEETVRTISAKKNEPSFLLDFRLRAFARFQEMQEPDWANLRHPPIDYQDICYYSAPKKRQSLSSLQEVDPEIIKTFERLGIPLDEQKRLSNVAVDVVFDSVSLGTTFQKTLKEAGVVLCPISEAVRQRCSCRRQLFCRAQFCCLFRWLLRLYSQRGTLSGRTLDLFPYQ